MSSLPQRRDGLASATAKPSKIGRGFTKPFWLMAEPPRWPLKRVGNHMILAIVYARHQRDQLLCVALDALERHRNQVEFHLSVTLDDEQIREVAVYAAALRDVPQQEGFPYQVQWPSVPSCLSRSIVQ